MAAYKMACRCPGCGVIWENGKGIIEYETDNDTVLFDSFDNSWFHCDNCNIDMVVGDVEDCIEIIERFDEDERRELLKNEIDCPAASVIYITKSALKTGKILAASVKHMDKNGYVYCFLDNSTPALYKPGEWYYTPEDALAAVDHEKELEIERLKTMKISVDHSNIK